MFEGPNEEGPKLPKSSIGAGLFGINPRWPLTLKSESSSNNRPLPPVNGLLKLEPPAGNVEKEAGPDRNVGNDEEIGCEKLLENPGLPDGNLKDDEEIGCEKLLENPGLPMNVGPPPKLPLLKPGFLKLPPVLKLGKPKLPPLLKPGPPVLKPGPKLPPMLKPEPPVLKPEPKLAPLKPGPKLPPLLKPGPKFPVLKP